MKVLVACEYSGRVRDAFRAKGHEAWSCDFKPTISPGPHFKTNVKNVISSSWDMVIAFPPCTYLSKLAAVNGNYGGAHTKSAMEFVIWLWESPVDKIAIENPVGYLSSHWRKPTQYIEPYQFGHPYTKKTCLWLDGLPRLKCTTVVKPLGRWVFGGGSASYSRQTTDMAPIKADRNLTFPGIAQAMAEQWG